MNGALQARKHALRVELRTRRRALDPEALTAASAKVVARLLDTEAWQRSRVVALYAATRGELDLFSLFDCAGARRLALPVTPSEGRLLEFRSLQPGASLEAGRFGILEPPPQSSQRVPREQLDLVLIPGIAFDPSGARLGQGGGYYDASFVDQAAFRVGIAHDFQIVPSLPHETHDLSMQLILTPKTVLRPPEISAKDTPLSSP